jgi:hypothetical protein
MSYSSPPDMILAAVLPQKKLLYPSQFGCQRHISIELNEIISMTLYYARFYHSLKKIVLLQVIPVIRWGNSINTIALA